MFRIGLTPFPTLQKPKNHPHHTPKTQKSPQKTVWETKLDFGAKTAYYQRLKAILKY
jgi:hypothetical protein